MKKPTYISLFSSAGVGCYGFKMNDFDCVATNELLPSRIAVQRANHKCKYESGYVCGDATLPETHSKIFEQIELWKEREGLEQVDVVFATPPCQGMSTVNYKKTDHEQVRNSLVVQAIKLIREIKPKVFVFENVRAFMKSTCTDLSGKDIPIQESIYKNLSGDYHIYWKVINFMDYGVPSSRPRTVVIGTSKAIGHLSPLLLFPTREAQIPLKDSIGGFPRLAYCEKDKHDPLHFARPFPEYMLPWIKDLKEGETAFDNPDETKPYTLDAQGNRIINKGAYMGNKYRRLFWNKPGACIATRNDIMSSQDTLHPCDNRVLSIRELMTLMTIPDTFRWTDHDDELTVSNADEYMKENEGNIRRCIGEAVPTHIGYTVAKKIRASLVYGECLDEKGNYYLEANGMGYGIHPQKEFGQVMGLDDSLNTVNIYVDDAEAFVNAAPQLASYFSHIDHLNIDLVGFAENEESNLMKLLGLVNLGTHTHVELCAKRSLAKAYHLKVTSQGIAPVKSQPQRTSKAVAAEQLCLF